MRTENSATFAWAGTTKLLAARARPATPGAGVLPNFGVRVNYNALAAMSRRNCAPEDAATDSIKARSWHPIVKPPVSIGGNSDYTG